MAAVSGPLVARLAGRVGALDLDVAFAAAPGAVTALTGASGAGKTTILRCLAGLARLPGLIKIGDETWQDARRFVPAHRRRVGYVFQGANLLPHLDVARNLAYAARRAARPMDGTAIVARTGIGGLLDRRPATLSGGEQQRVALARALLSAPHLLLLDEPLSALDQAARSGFRAYLAEALPSLAIPVLLVSHDPTDVSDLASVALQLKAGRILP